MNKSLGIYIHIPFCVRKCNYCDFLSFACDDETKEKYVGVLKNEIRKKAENVSLTDVDSVFFGGGTPSVLDVHLIEEIMRTVKESFAVDENAEITIEANPGTLTADKLRTYKEAGINRISMGLQSADETELKVLGRIHTWKDFLESFTLAREAGFDNINIDLMSSLPNQSIESYKETLRKVLELNPEHISAYSLIIEENTKFYDLYKKDLELQMQGEKPESLPDEETERLMYELTEQMLADAGYFRYEISNYAKPGFESRHNEKYWQCDEYIGFGLGASSYINKRRIKNTSDLNIYMSDPFAVEEELVLDETAQMEEFMFMGLRMTKGVSADEFMNRFGVSIKCVYGDALEKLINEKLLMRLTAEDGNETYKLSAKGVNVSNYVFEEMLIN